MIDKIVSMIVVVFLLNVSLASALNMNLIKNGQTETVRYDKIFNRTVTETNSTVKVEINPIQNKTITNILLYLCGDKDVLECIDSNATKPIKYRTSVDSEFLKSDVYKNGKSNILSFLEIDGSWLADFYPSADHTVDVRLKANINDTKKSLEKGLLPLGFTESIDLKTSFYQIVGVPVKEDKLGKKALNFTSKELTSTVKDKEGYSFLFPAGLEPLTVYNVEEKCGNAKCELGESYDICWQDCRCPVGQVPTSKGCVTKDIKLVVDNQTSDTIKCIPGEERCRALDPDFKISLHMESGPQEYRLNRQFMYVGDKRDLNILCTSTDSKPRIDVVGNSVKLTYNGTKFECKPAFDIPLKEVGKKSLSINFLISYETQNGTETEEVAGQTELTIENAFAGIDELNRVVQKAQDKAKDFEKDTKEIRAAAEVLKTFEYIFGATAVVWCACCGLTWGACGCGACGEFAVATAVTELIIRGMDLAVDYCTGKHGGTGGRWARQAVNTCREIGRWKDYSEQKIAEAQGLQKTAIKEHVPNLIWANGEQSGFAVDKVCGQERTEIKYLVEDFECEQTWFNLNIEEAPLCDCNSGNFVKVSPLATGSCSCQNTTTNQWILDSENKSIQYWNSTGIGTLFNNTSNRLFPSSQELNLTLYCNSERFGEIKETFKILEYEPQCSGLATALGSGINPFGGTI